MQEQHTSPSRVLLALKITGRGPGDPRSLGKAPGATEGFDTWLLFALREPS